MSPIRDAKLLKAAMAAPTPRDAKRARPAALEARVSTIELPELGKVCSVLAVKGGARFLGTASALYLQVDGRLALIAGHSSETGFKDGKGDKALPTVSLSPSLSHPELPPPLAHSLTLSSPSWGGL